MLNLLRRTPQAVVDSEVPTASDDGGLTLPDVTRETLVELKPSCSELAKQDLDTLLKAEVKEVERRIDISLDITARKATRYVQEGLEQVTTDTFGMLSFSGGREQAFEEARKQLEEMAAKAFESEYWSARQIRFEVAAGNSIFSSDASIANNVFEGRAERYSLTFDRPIDYPAVVNVESSHGNFSFELSGSRNNQKVKAREGTFEGSAFLVSDPLSTEEVRVSKIFLVGHRF